VTINVTLENGKKKPLEKERNPGARVEMRGQSEGNANSEFINTIRSIPCQPINFYYSLDLVIML